MLLFLNYVIQRKVKQFYCYYNVARLLAEALEFHEAGFELGANIS